MKIIVYFLGCLLAFSQGVTKTVAIIGAGPSGIVAAKSAVESGLQPTILEKNSDIGGVWDPNQGSTWESMRTNLSKFSCMFSDFPWKASVGDFPLAFEVQNYLKDYIAHFKLSSFINLGAEVIRVGFNESNQSWKVVYKQNGELVEREFTYVIVASGFFSQPLMPSVDTSQFSGTILHSQQYKIASSFVDKEVVVVGGAFTGVEIAAEVAKVAKKVTHISTKKFWVLPRYLMDESFKKKLPLDAVFYKRKTSSLLTPQEINQGTHHYFSLLSRQGEISEKLLIKQEDYASYPFVVISDTYLDQVEMGRVSIYDSKVVGMEENGVVLEDGSKIRADVVIFCTGFTTHLPYFEESLLTEMEFEAKDQFQPLLLYEGVFHPKLPNMAFIGMYRGPYFGVMELQARWACMAFADKKRYYPTSEELKNGIKKERNLRELDPRPQFPHGDYVAFLDALAEKIHVCPLLRKDDVISTLAVIPAQFRLQGPYSNKEVALAILTEYEHFVLGVR
ncbi:MAG: FAD-dependent oxidoreductase [Chlamydiota bacterium]